MMTLFLRGRSENGYGFKNGCEKWHFSVWKRVRIWRTERHSLTKHSSEYPPPGTQLINPFNKMGKVKILTKNADLFLYNPNKGSAQPVSGQTSVPEVPSSISKCNLKSLFRYLFFPCSSKSFYIGIFGKRSSDEEGVGMTLSFAGQNKDLYL